MPWVSLYWSELEQTLIAYDEMDRPGKHQALRKTGTNFSQESIRYIKCVFKYLCDVSCQEEQRKYLKQNTKVDKVCRKVKKTFRKKKCTFWEAHFYRVVSVILDWAKKLLENSGIWTSFTTSVFVTIMAGINMVNFKLLNLDLGDYPTQWLNTAWTVSTMFRECNVLESNWKCLEQTKCTSNKGAWKQ